MIPRDLQYDLPEAAYLLLLAFGIAFLWYGLWKFRLAVLERWGSGRAHPALGMMRSPWVFGVGAALLTLVWVLGVFALMQPKGNARYPIPKTDNSEEVPLRRKAHDVVYFIDASASMGVKDTRTGVTRLQAAMEVADEIASRMDGQSQALYAFTSRATKMVPATLDYLFLRLMIQQVRINEGDIAGTNLKESLKTFREAFLSKDEPSLKTLVILSDGGDTVLEDETGSARQQRIQEIIEELGDPQEEHLRVFTIGIGTDKGQTVPGIQEAGVTVTSRLQADVLEALAKQGRGSYYQANSYSSLDIADDLFAKISKDNQYYRDVAAGGPVDERTRIYDLYFQIPLGLALLLLTFVLLFPTTTRAMLVVFFIGIVPLEAAVSPLQREIETLVEAEHFDQALDVIEKQLSAQNPSWLHNNLLYNQGTIWLRQNDPKKALGYFLEIQTQSPVLQARLKWNIAIARYLIAKQVQTSMQEGKLEFHDYVAAIILFREARYDAQQAQEAYCNLQTKSGWSACVPSDFLTRLDQASENALVGIIKGVRLFLMDQAPLVQVLPALDYSLYDSQFELKFLKDLPMDAELTKRYQALFAKEQETWMPLWEAVAVRLGETDPAKFIEAYESYQSGLELLKQGQIKESSQALRMAQTHLETLYKSLNDANPLEGPLQKLLFGYRLALSVYPLQTLELSQLMQEQNQIAKLFPDNPYMEEAQELLHQSLEGLKKGEKETPRLFLQVASFQIRRILHTMEKHSPQEHLKFVVEAQEEAEFILHVLGERTAPNSEALLQLAEHAQQLVEASLDLFWASARESQLEGFKTKCQGQPWGTVLPLVDRGRRLSLQAGSLIPTETVSLAVIIDLQEQAQEQYRKALNQWDEAAKKEGCGGGGGEPKPEPKAPKKETPSQKEDQKPAPQPQPSTSNLLRLLKELEQDDRRPPEQKVRVPQGVKPW